MAEFEFRLDVWKDEDDDYVDALWRWANHPVHGWEPDGVLIVYFGTDTMTSVIARAYEEGFNADEMLAAGLKFVELDTEHFLGSVEVPE